MAGQVCARPPAPRLRCRGAGVFAVLSLLAYAGLACARAGPAIHIPATPEAAGKIEKHRPSRR